MVNIKPFTSSRSSNENWFMSATLSHEMSHASCLNSEAYTEVGRDPWRRVCNLLVDVCYLFELPKKTPNSSRNASKSFKSGD